MLWVNLWHPGQNSIGHGPWFQAVRLMLVAHVCEGDCVPGSHYMHWATFFKTLRAAHESSTGAQSLLGVAPALWEVFPEEMFTGGL